jgi:adenine specific DNA methylase Mod
MTGKLFYGDNLSVLREHIASESIDLVYLDPPFNSAATYNVLFRAPDGAQSQAQIEAFEDTWHWGIEAERAFDEVLRSGHGNAAELVRALRGVLGENDMMAYLTMMAVRLIELHRVLKFSGSLYLHCDPTASHYLKVLLDAIFGIENFRTDITWKRAHAHSDSKQGRRGYGNIADHLLYYVKSATATFNVVHIPYDQAYVDKYYRYRDENGRRYWLDNLTGPGGAAKGNPYYEVMGVSRHWRYSQQRMTELIAAGRVVQTKPGNVPQFKRYLDEMPGVPLQNVWTDVSPINMMAVERLGYPTQKPLALLERIIAASSNPGDTVLDPFCGCGTAVHAAEKLGRNWIGIDVTHLAISLIERRLKDAFPAIRFTVEGTPTDLAGARDLAARDKYQFQWWAVSLVDAVPQGGRKKGADRGIDGIRYVQMGPRPGDVDRVLVSVKGGEHVTSSMIRDLKGTIERERALGGLFITLAPPTREMEKEAASAGFFETSFGRHPKIQILPVAELLANMRPDLPALGRFEGFRRAAREKRPAAEQAKLALE